LKSDNSLALSEDGENYLSGTGTQKIERPGKSEKDSVLQDPNYYGKLNQVIEKLQSIRQDRRYNFLFPTGYEESTSISGYLIDLLSIPYNTEQKQLTILDLSRIPSEITPIIIGMLGRICFEFKLWEETPSTLPLYLVFEEAHNYIPKESTPTSRLPKKHLERIAKEGRKYGITQLIISQRPSDLSTTIISQCSNFFVLRVTNPEDQSFIRHILPDHLSSLTNMIPFFQNGEALIVGECVPMPVKGIIDKPSPAPNSNDVSFSNAWSRLMESYDINRTLYRWWDVKEDE
jgi:DNA helicase HerA-like ATPase